MGADNDTEIERKYLVKNSSWQNGVLRKIFMRAGFISHNSKNHVRIQPEKLRLVIDGKNDKQYLIPFDNKRKLQSLKKLLDDEPGCTIRIRLENDEAFLVFKGSPKKDDPLSKPEITVPLAFDLGEKLLNNLCVKSQIVTKTRHIVPFDGKNWEVDVFEGANKGLVVAELELETSSEKFKSPAWLGKEVSDDGRYTNSSLAKNPISKWKK